ncbi:MAG TPA: polysaccharide ABC transporter ATP-binding protein [Parasulfuritortus sp.]
MPVVIKLENVSKRYLIDHKQGGGYDTLRDSMANKVRNILDFPKKIFGTRSNGEDKNREEFWALDDLSLEIQQGDRVGIVGRNGAGKSTLLKVLSRITEPTFGRVCINGRVSSLLEVGTGFHPELTGRENIYLNGAILGMSKADIARKFDEIVAFAEVERFLDTPVKRYSSGMYVRLAFAVAAHLEPDILIVDEVLAVGDALFQKKCLGKIEDIGAEGRTVLFVSHNMAAISRLTNNCVLLNRGKVELFGATDQVIQRYIGGDERNILSTRRPVEDIFYIKRWKFSDVVEIKEVGVIGERGVDVMFDGELTLELLLSVKHAVDDLSIGFGISPDGEFKIMGGFSSAFSFGERGEYVCRLVIRGLNLAPACYSLDLSIGTGTDVASRKDYEAIQGVGSFHVLPYKKDFTPIGEWVHGWGMTINTGAIVNVVQECK